MDFHIVDAGLVLVLLLGAFAGWRSGFVLAALELIALALSLAAAFVGYGYLEAVLRLHWPASRVWVAPFCFLVLFVVAHMLLGSVVTRLVRSVPRQVHGNRLNRFFGMGPGLINGGIYASLLAVVLLTIPVWPRLNEAARRSVLAEPLAQPVSTADAWLGPIFDPAIRRTMRAMTVAPRDDAMVRMDFKVPDPRVRPDLEASMLKMLNEERVKRGLKPLAPDPQATQVAREHSRDMFERGYFSHETLEGRTLEDRFRAGRVRYLAAGENLAYAHSVPQAHEGLMNSPGHRANILRPQFGRVGIGVLDGGLYGLMVTENFRDG